MNELDPKILEMIEMERQGLVALNQARFEEAAEWFRKILAIDPGWEEGLGFYNLACALDEIGKLKEARRAFERALIYRPDEVIFWGGYASFLYEFGDPGEALAAHLSLYKNQERLEQTEGMKRTRIGITALGKKLGLSEKEIEERIAQHLE